MCILFFLELTINKIILRVSKTVLYVATEFGIDPYSLQVILARKIWYQKLFLLLFRLSKFNVRYAMFPQFAHAACLSYGMF